MRSSIARLFARRIINAEPMFSSMNIAVVSSQRLILSMVESFIISAEPFGFSSSALISLRVNLFIVFLPCFRAAEPFGGSSFRLLRKSSAQF